ncbi:MAG: MarR family transcriptional regulator [Methylococcaceae bacterium]
MAFIYSYTKVNRRAPAEVDIQHFFNVTPPTVQQMILTLEKSGFISREPGKALTIKVLLPPRINYPIQSSEILCNNIRKL